MMRKLLLTGMGIIYLFSSFNIIKKGPKLPKEFTSIPAGSFQIYPDSSKVTLDAFYMSKFEVSNKQYRDYYNEVSPGLSEDEKQKIACDSSGWNEMAEYGEPLRNHYFKHAAYDNYPVVNISHDAAQKYCEWLEEKIQKDNPNYEVSVRLPTRAEWVWAARGGRSQAMFPWGNYYLRNNRGEPLCNFKRVPDHAIYRNRKTGEPEVSHSAGNSPAALVTTPVKSFFPNNFGLYNMCGNVAEMISENHIAMGGSWNDYGGDVHILSRANYEKIAMTVGFRVAVTIRYVQNQFHD